MVVDSLENEGFRLLLHENISFALSWLQSSQTSQLSPGTYELRGQELMGYAPVRTLDPGPYDDERDVQFHYGHVDFLLLREGMFAIMLPGDAHMPGVSVVDLPEPVKKIVVKIAADCLG